MDMALKAYQESKVTGIGKQQLVCQLYSIRQAAPQIYCQLLWNPEMPVCCGG